MKSVFGLPLSSLKLWECGLMHPSRNSSWCSKEELRNVAPTQAPAKRSRLCRQVWQPCSPHRHTACCSATYLGIEVSLDNYVQRTCKLRMPISGSIRQRLLESPAYLGLGLRMRVLLYASVYAVPCSTVSMQLDLRPVCSDCWISATPGILRAISRSPAHIHA